MSSGPSGQIYAPSRFSPAPYIRAAILTLSAVFLILHFFHIQSDYPNNSPWHDWAKFTDEGWYGYAAIREVQLGHWYLPGEFNSAAALPVWPMLEFVPFKLFGATMAVARYFTLFLFVLICAASWLLLYRWTTEDNPRSSPSGLRSLAPELAVLLLTVSPFCYVNVRLAILEPAIILETLLGLLIASAIVTANGRSTRPWFLVAIGALCPIMVLTKTTAISLLPAIVFLVWNRAGSASQGTRAQVRLFARWSLIAAGAALLVIVPYVLTVRHLHLAADIHNYFAAASDRVNRHNAVHFALADIQGIHWIGICFAPICVLAAVLALLRLRRNPIIPTLLLWTAGYLFFIWYHTNLQPRYYLVPAVALFLLVAYLAALPFLNLTADSPRPRKFLAAAVALLIVTAVCVEASQTLQYALHPEYTYLSAARSIHEIIEDDATQPHLLLSTSGADIMLMTGTRAITDEVSILHTVPIVQRFNPGWFALWGGGWEDRKLRALEPHYNLREVARFNVMDDPTRNPLILYRIEPRNDQASPALVAAQR